MKRKIVFALLAASIVAISSVLGFYFVKNGSDDRADGPWCWDLITGDDLDKLGIDLGESYSYKGGPEEVGINSVCRITVDGGAQISLTVRNYAERDPMLYTPGAGVESPWPAYRSAMPIGGRKAGWVGQEEAHVWLPSACQNKIGDPLSPVMVSLNASTEMRSQSRELMLPAMRNVLLEKADQIASELNCAKPGWSGSENFSVNTTVHESTNSDVCGIEGLDEVWSRPGVEADTREHVAGSVEDSWSCLLEVANKDLVAFTVTKVPQFVDRFPGFVRDRSKASGPLAGEQAGPGGIVIRSQCGGEATVLSMEYPADFYSERLHEQAVKHLKSRDRIMEKFATAVGKKLDCEMNRS